MIYISVQPDIPYFHWQVEVMLTNFQQVEIEKCHVIFLYDHTISTEVQMLKRRFPQYDFYFYLDEREMRARMYIPTIKPYGMYKHLKNISIEEAIFYHDCDIIFKEKIDEKKFEADDVWYLSDTISYIGYNYVISKGEDQALKMCNVIGISLSEVEQNQMSSGGAQYIVKNTIADFWWKVYADSYLLYEMLNESEKSWTKEEYPIQKWCAEMWATLWNIWLFKFETKVDKELDFVFATAPISEMENCKIMHNAGVTNTHTSLFFKGGYINQSPFNADLSHVDSQFCSHFYKNAIDRVIENRK